MRGVPLRQSARMGASARKPDQRVVDRVNELLGVPMSEAYRPTLPAYSLRAQKVLGWDLYADVEVMRLHPAVNLPLAMVMSSMAMAEWDVTGSGAEEARYAGEVLLWWWNNAMYAVQEEGNVYGWAACELVWHERGGVLRPYSTITYSSRDVQPVVLEDSRRPTGVEVVTGYSAGVKRLWGFRADVPNKCFWYTHRPRHQSLYGQSQLRGAWKPWRSLAGIDGQEEIIALANYRFGTGIVKVYHPEGNYTGALANMPAWATPGANTGAAVSNNMVARQVAETLKNGAAIALDSTPYPGLAGGGKKWDVVVESFNTNISQLLEGKTDLHKDCALAIGISPELITASETGSGYSGRAIPLQGFLMNQQRQLNDMTAQFMEQVVCPAVRWMFGPDKWVEARPKPLIKTYRKAAWDQSGGGDAAGGGQSQQQAVSGAGQPPFAQGQATAGQPQG